MLNCVPTKGSYYHANSPQPNIKISRTILWVCGVSWLRTISLTRSTFSSAGGAPCGLHSGVKVSRNAPERCSGARKFRLGAFWLQNHLISQPERTFLGPASYSNIRYSNPIISHSNFTFLRSQIHIVKCFFTKFYKIAKKNNMKIMLNTFSQSLII